ncbi:hypothetical protein [Sphingomonas bacterium]|uniref:hypothetical protein n=1 Tax=Sphingomonas bacterium TaxID=1895847 RepID=UPI001575538F|nr:hypothetical protein [Sphingomonas bacterium]
MDVQDEAGLREQAGRLALDWSQERHGDFTGEQPVAYVPLIEAAAVVADEAKLSLGRWVKAGRRGGLSWSDIGRVVGVSKQAAQQRFGADEAREAGPGMITVTLGATAFNEVAMLRREGAAGRELVAVAALRLFFRQTDRPWLHRRTVAEMDPGLRLAEGWEAVASWFIFHYYKRPA